MYLIININKNLFIFYLTFAAELKIMGYKTTLEQKKIRTKSNSKVATNISPIALTFLGLIFMGMLILSSMHDYLFFEWLAMGSSIVFALVGIHLLGKQQIKRN